jgi:transposase
MLISARQGLINDRTALVNRTRAFLLERGFVLPLGIAALQNRLPELLDDGANSLTLVTRTLIRELQAQIRSQTEKIGEIDAMMKMLVRSNETGRRLQTVPGVGPLIAAALISVIGDPKRFGSGRDMAAFLGLVPSQHTSGDKVRLGRVTKRGDSGLRSLLVQGAQAALRAAELSGSGKMKDGKLRTWLLDLLKRKDTRNKAVVALANKMARMAWAIWKNDTVYTAAA